MNIFNTPILSNLLHHLAILIFRLKGWTIKGDAAGISRCVLICAPHTSNWDFPYMIAIVFIRKMSIKWIGKHTLFPPVFGAVSRWFGGVGVNRSQAKDVVGQMADEFSTRDDFILIITPEGTRSKVKQWKTGFYRIALKAGVPVVPAYIDYPSKTAGFGEPFYPTGDQETDIAYLQNLYTNYRGRGIHA